MALVAALAGCSRPKENQDNSSRLIAAMNSGVSLMGQYQFDEAAKMFQEALDLDPGLADAKVNLAVSLFNRNRKEDRDLDNASALLDEVLEKDAENVRALYFKGIVQQHVGNAQQAVQCFEKVVQQRPEDGAAWYLLGLCKMRVDQPAEQEFLRAVQLRPYLYSAHYKLSQIALRKSEGEKAKEYLELFTRLRESPLGESIELPQYDQMGELALARPLPSQAGLAIASSRYSPHPPLTLHEQANPPLWTSNRAADPNAFSAYPQFGGVAAGDANGDGRLDLVLVTRGADGLGGLVLLLGKAGGGLRDSTTGSGLEQARKPVSCAWGDYDNDEKTDLYVACAGDNHLFKGTGDGTFTDVTRATGTGGGAVVSTFVMFLDADHDADLDILVCNARTVEGGAPAANQLFNNNADGTFTNIALQAGIACEGKVSLGALTGDLDSDRDLDLVIFQEDAPPRLFVNSLFGRYREADPGKVPFPKATTGLLQDFSGDGRLDLVTLGAGDPALALHLGDGHGQFQPSAVFRDVAKSASSWGALRAVRGADVDLDGDLDMACIADAGHLLLNSGTGRFVLQPQTWQAAAGAAWTGADLFDFNGDIVPDLLCMEVGQASRLTLAAGEVSPPPTGFALQPTGVRSRDGRTRSPASGYGLRVTVRTGLREQGYTYTGLSGGPNQSQIPMAFGLGGASRADYVNLQWPDGVQQVEIGLAAGQKHQMSETQRKISSCPVLFAWDGRRFGFVTDFAGVGGLGYYVGPGQFAQPQVLEHVKIEPGQLQAKDGSYDLRVSEPMEEIAYVDRLELLAVDHPADWTVWPDERLAIRGPCPTHRLLVVDHPIGPVTALGPGGAECTERVSRADRRYAYDPPLDQRFIGFCHPHTLELDFGEELARLNPAGELFLFVRGYIEYPYSQTVYAAGQAQVGWQPIRLESLSADGAWQTVTPDAGVPGGLDRTMTVELTGLLNQGARRLRLTTNLEVYYDQVFLAATAPQTRLAVHQVPLQDARLSKSGFPREYSPDGRLPLSYDYALMDATAPFHVPRGAYTRYGDVTSLLREFDDRYVLVGPGEEIALRFQADALPSLGAGQTRSFILVSHAYCKDMDLYTAAPETIEPLPFRGMSRYPYPAGEHYPDTAANRSYQTSYNTRLVR